MFRRFLLALCLALGSGLTTPTPSRAVAAAGGVAYVVSRGFLYVYHTGGLVDVYQWDTLAGAWTYLYSTAV